MKQKLLFGIGVFLLLLLGTGISAVCLLNKLSDNFVTANQAFLDRQQALQSLRFDTSTINVFYIPELMKDGEVAPEKKQADHFEEGYASMRSSLAKLRNSEVTANRQFERLDDVLGEYEGVYRGIFENFPVDMEDKRQRLAEISEHTQQISDISQGLLAAEEVKIRNANLDFSANARKSSWLMGALMLFGLLASGQVYHQACRSMVDPVVELTDSVRQIQKGNFELSLPVRRTKDEVAELIPAFNEMAAELRIMRRATDEKLLHVDLLNRAILASFPHPIMLLDADGKMLKVNPEAERLLEDLQLLNTLPKRLDQLTRQALADGEEHLPDRLDEAILLRRDDKEFFYLPRIFKLATLDDKAEGWVVLLTDVTRLRFFDDLKSNLIATVSHEIKTPLTGIRMVIHLLLEKKIGELNGIQEEMLTSAHADCERLLETLRNLLEMTRIDSGADSLNLIETDMRPIIKGCLSLFEKNALEKNVIFDLDLRDDLPRVMVDEIRIREVLNNLVSNAIKHTPPSTTVTVLARPQGADFVRFAVLDRGPGVPEEAKAKVFDRFFRAPGQGPVEGIGLGLSIAREIVTAHNGRIGLKNGINGETKFYFDLPRA